MIRDVPDRSGARRTHRPGAPARRLVAVAALVAAFAIGIAGCRGGDDEEDTAATTTTVGGQTTTSAEATTTTGTEGTAGSNESGGKQAGTRHSQLGVIDAVLTSADAAKACGADYVTTQYLNAAYGGEQGCIQAQSPQSAAKSLKFSDVIQVKAGKPPHATVRAIPEGGLYNGDRLTVTLVGEGGGWKVDAIESNAPVGP